MKLKFYIEYKRNIYIELHIESPEKRIVYTYTKHRRRRRPECCVVYGVVFSVLESSS